MSAKLSPDEQAKALRLRDDFPFFARNCLRVRTKEGSVVPFKLNAAQLHLHERFEAQRAQTGRVRAIILKGRQMGCSTLIQARYYWRLWGGRGLRAFILTHEQAATDNLFGMAQRFHDNMPAPVKPPTKSANAKELAFSDNDCSYSVATAGTKEVGRSSTVQLAHLSEAAFWPNADNHIAGLFQAIPNAAGTESIIESTANGIGNMYQRTWVSAERGDSEYEPIFMPWHWDGGYQIEPPEGWEPPGEWGDYAEAHRLTWEQLYWAYTTNRTMANAIGEPTDKPCWKYLMEYPSTASEAFQSSGNSFIPATVLMKARVGPVHRVIGQGPLIIGVDPARGGGDKTGVVDRRGRRIGQLVCERWDETDLMAIAAKVARLINLHHPAAVNIDVTGLGAGVYDRLAEMGYHEVNPVNFGEAALGLGPTGDVQYANRRAEIWDTMREWFNDTAGVQMPDDDVLHGDLASVVWGPSATRFNSNSKLILEPKDKVKERLGHSCDLADACALTFSIPLAVREPIDRDERRRPTTRTGY